MDIPLGFRFCPTDQELVVHFLKRKIHSQDLPRDIIIPEVDLYEYGRPEYLLGKFKPQMDSGKEKHWYFLTLLKPKHRGGKRPSRITGLDEGVWKATGRPNPIQDDDDQNITLGYKRSFCYYQTKPKKGKTNWIMYELAVDADINWVLCEIHHHSSGSESSQEVKEVSNASPKQLNTDDVSYRLSTLQEPMQAMMPYSYDTSQIHSSSNTMVDMQYDDNMQFVDGLWRSSSYAPSIPCMPSHTKIDMQCGGNMQFVNNLRSSSSSDQSIPCAPFCMSREHDSRFSSFNQNLINRVAALQSNGSCMPSNKIDMQFDGKMRFVNNLLSSSSSFVQSMPCGPSRTSREEAQDSHH